MTVTVGLQCSSELQWHHALAGYCSL